MTRLFAAVHAVHESLVGTFRTWRDVRLESAVRAKADVEQSICGLDVTRDLESSQC
jgi:hypothetical protein